MLLADTLIAMSDAHTREVLGKIVTRLRERDGLDQAKLAARAGISRSSVSRIEGGEQVKDRQVSRIEDILNQPLGLFDAILRDDRQFIRQLPEMDANYRATILHWLADRSEDDKTA